jgi:hypothetical protein
MNTLDFDCFHRAGNCGADLSISESGLRPNWVFYECFKNI